MKLDSPISLWSRHEILGSVKSLDQEGIQQENHFQFADLDFAYRHGGDGLRSILDLNPVQREIGSDPWIVNSLLQYFSARKTQITRPTHLDIFNPQDRRKKIICSFGGGGRTTLETSECQMI